MNATPAPYDDADVHAYADGGLPPPRVEAFEAAMQHDPSLAARVGQIRTQSADLRAALDSILSEPIPERLLHAATRPSRAVLLRRGLRMGAPAFAAAALLVIGVAIGWFGRAIDMEAQGVPTSFPRQAAFTHALYAADVNRPVEVWAAEEQRLVTWLTKRLGRPMHAPDLNQFGYALVGGRLVAGNERPTALFMYENGDRRRLSLQVRKEPTQGDTAFRYAIEDGVGIFYWIDDQCSYALTGSLDRGQLLAMARLIYGQLAALDNPPR